MQQRSTSTSTSTTALALQCDDQRAAPTCRQARPPACATFEAPLKMVVMMRLKSLMTGKPSAGGDQEWEMAHVRLGSMRKGCGHFAKQCAWTLSAEGVLNSWALAAASKNRSSRAAAPPLSLRNPSSLHVTTPWAPTLAQPPRPAPAPPRPRPAPPPLAHQRSAAARAPRSSPGARR